MFEMSDVVLDGLVFYGVPVLPGSDLHEALEEVERTIHPLSPEELLALDEPKYEPGTNPQLALAQRLRDADRDPYERLPESPLYLGMAGDRACRLYYFSDGSTYVPTRHLVQLHGHIMTPKRLLEREAKIRSALDDLGVTKDIGSIGFYCGGQVR